MSSIWTLRRSATDSKASGLCGGLAAHWNVDPVLVRVGAIILALSGGIGLVLYVAGWLLIPVEGQTKAPVDDILGEQARKIPREAWIVIVAILCMVFFGALGALMPFGVGPALVLVAVWYFGFYRKRAEQSSEPAAAPLPQPLETTADQDTIGNPFAGPSTPFTEAARAWQARIAAYERAQSTGQGAEVGRTGSAPQDFPTYPHQPAASTVPPVRPDGSAPQPTEPAPQPSRLPTAPPPPEVTYFSVPDPVGIYTEPAPVAVAANEATVSRRRDSIGARRLRLVSIIVLGLAMAGLGVISWLGPTVPVLAWLGAALLVVSLTLVAGAFVGRPRGTMVAAIVLAVSVISTGLAGLAVGPTGPIEPYSVRYASLESMPASQNREFGQMDVDLSAVDVNADQTFEVGVDVGSVRLVVPEGENVIIRHTVDVGSYDILGTTNSGADLSGSTERIVDPDEPVLTIDIRADAGSVEVTQ
ncbi:MAG: PspC domain-containing protein [Propionibacteriaceae bacterium]